MAGEDKDVLKTSDGQPPDRARPPITARTYSLKTSRARKPEVTETHQSIDEQVEAYLKAGKEIQQISRGVSGKPDIQPGQRRDIHLGNKYKTV